MIKKVIIDPGLARSAQSAASLEARLQHNNPGTNHIYAAVELAKERDRLFQDRAHLIAALKEAKCLLSDCYRKFLWLRHDVDYEDRNEEQRVIGPIDAISLQIKAIEATINKVLGQSTHHD